MSTFSLSALTLTLVSTALLSATSALGVEQKVTIDPAKSTLAWVGKKVTGQHDGSVKIQSGVVTLVDNKPVTGSFEIDLGSIAVRDISDPKKNSDLVGHLKSDDFFSAATYPTARFNITKFTELVPVSPTGENYQVTGDLIVKGITNEVTFPAKIQIGTTVVTADAVTTIDRTKWNVRYNSGKFFTSLGDKLINDNFEVSVHLEGSL